jgi:hypothetical protein
LSSKHKALDSKHSTKKKEKNPEKKSFHKRKPTNNKSREERKEQKFHKKIKGKIGKKNLYLSIMTLNLNEYNYPVKGLQ